MFLVFLFSIYVSLVLGYNPCNVRSVKHGNVCVCNATYCDTVPDLIALSSGEYQIFTTSSANPGFSSTTGAFNVSSDSVSTTITVNVTEKYQSIIGFGGAFTDSTGINILSLSEEVQQKLLESYFGSTGIEYNLCRVPIGGTDFSSRGYTYCDTKDTTLANFSLQEEDYTYKIPLIQKAQQLRNNLTFNLFASAWTAPPWMKSNNEYSGFGWLKTEYYQLWADYYIKFLDAYAESNITFWGLTTQNEPIDGFFPRIFSKLNAMGWLPSWMNNWVGTNLGPTLRNNTNHSNVKIILHDDNRVLLPILKKFTLSNETVLQYVDGVGVHVYTDFFTPASLLEDAKSPNKDLFLIGTEACEGSLHYFGVENSVELGSWKRGRRYANYILDDIKYGAAGWVDWNMVLNENGGPSYININVDAPIIVNETAGEFYKQPLFYVQGHFSKFVLPESVRIGTSIDTGSSLRAAAFLRPDNLVSVFMHNSKESELEVEINISGNATVIKLEPLSFNTLLYSLKDA